MNLAKFFRGRLAAAVVGCAVGWVAGCAPDAEDPAPAEAEAEGTRPAEGTPRDWEIVRAQLGWARSQGLDTLPDFGDVVATLGERFVGTTYTPHTLEVPGPERLVINLEALDCVTFVENVLALSRIVRGKPPGLLDDDPLFRAAYRDELVGIRYRGGVLAGYASRLHYFSEWISDAQAKGIVEDVSKQLGGKADDSPVNFMSTHPDAYRQLQDPAVAEEIAAAEERLRPVERFFLPAEEIDAKAHLIRTGDIIAATSTVPGLDVAHTGIAVWRDGKLRLLHAPLVGSHVQLSDESIAERIRRIGGQDGIMVARPLDPRLGLPPRPVSASDPSGAPGASG